MSTPNVLDHPGIFDLKIHLTPVTTLRLKRANLAEIKQQFLGRVKQAPLMFQNIQLSVDLSHCSDTIDHQFLLALSEFFSEHNIHFSGLHNPNPSQQQLAQACGVGICYSSQTQTPNVDYLQKRQPAMILHKPIRSGQTIQAHFKDLMIFGSVSQGAEVMADGNIFIYGSLRGKALAGVNGDTDARIFCKELDAELVAIADKIALAHTLPRRTSQSLIEIKLENQAIFVHEIGKPL